VPDRPDPTVLTWERLEPEHVEYQFVAGLGPFSTTLMHRVLDEEVHAYALVARDEDPTGLCNIRGGSLHDVAFHREQTARHLAARLRNKPEERIVFEWVLEPPDHRIFEERQGPKLAGKRTAYIPAAGPDATAIEAAREAAHPGWTSIGAVTRAPVPLSGTVTDEQARAWATQATVALFGAWDGLGLVLAEFTTAPA
jgi:hypothetical protein